jgi:hypothetical protein
MSKWAMSKIGRFFCRITGFPIDKPYSRLLVCVSTRMDPWIRGLDGSVDPLDP